MNKRILLLLTVFLCSIFTSLQAENWGAGDNIATEFSSLKDGVLTIMSAKELALLANKVNAGEIPSNDIKLGVEIDLAAGNWTPIGTSTHPYVGTFDGGNFKIKNMIVAEGQDDAGLFGVVGTNDVAAILKGFLLTTGGSVTGKTNVGALVGHLVNGTVSTCVNESVNVTGNENVGGLVGYIQKGSVTTSYNAGNVNGKMTLGGLVGLASDATVSMSYNAGKVFGSEESAGGVIGSLRGTGKVESVYNVGKVTGVSKIGGIVGSLIMATCKNNYNLSDVTGQSYVGSIAGDNTLGTLTANLYDKQLISLEGLGTGSGAKDIIDQAEGVSTKDLIEAFISAPWVATAGMYPRITGLSENDLAIVNAIPVTKISDNSPGVTDINSIIADFSLPIIEGLTWSSSDKKAILIGTDGKATVKRSTQADIPVVLTVNKGNRSRLYNVKVAKRIVYPVTLSVRESEKADIAITAVTEAEKLEENKYQLDEGASFIFKVKWPEYYEYVDVLVNNVKVTLNADKTFEIKNIKEAKTIVVKGELKKYNVAVTATSGGSVSVSPALQDGKVVHGTTLTLTASPDEFYQLDRWDPTNEKTKKITIVVKSDLSYQAVFTAMPTSKVDFTSDSEGVSFSISNYPLEETIKDLEVFYENTQGYEIIRQGSLIRFKVGVLAQYNSENMKVTLVNGTTETQLVSDPFGIYEVKDIENNVAIKVTGVRLGGFKLKIPAEEDIIGGKIDIYPRQDSYEYGTKIRVSAVADESYIFDKWSNGETEMVFSFDITGDMILPTPLFTSTVANEPVITNSPHVYSRGNTICIQQADGKNEEISIVNITGTVVAKKRIYSSSSEIQVAHKGIYVVSVGKHVQKVVVR